MVEHHGILEINNNNDEEMNVGDNTYQKDCMSIETAMETKVVASDYQRMNDLGNGSKGQPGHENARSARQIQKKVEEGKKRQEKLKTTHIEQMV